jgi:hypothetical protein
MQPHTDLCETAFEGFHGCFEASFWSRQNSLCVESMPISCRIAFIAHLHADYQFEGRGTVCGLSLTLTFTVEILTCGMPTPKHPRRQQ